MRPIVYLEFIFFEWSVPETVIKQIYNKPYVIAEAGCNHKGEIDIAKNMIITASTFCNVDAIKFQKRNNNELLTEVQYNSPHPNPIYSYGETYGAHREFLEFTKEQHRQLKEWCDEYKITYASSVWDLTSAKEISSPRCLMLRSRY